MMIPKRAETSCSIMVALGGDVWQESDEYEAEGVMIRVVAVVNPTGWRCQMRDQCWSQQT